MYSQTERMSPFSLNENIISSAAERATPPELAIIIPTFNERDNIDPLVGALTEALQGYAWEAIFVDDDSPDGTHASIAMLAKHDTRIRLLHRIGRRGLSSACVEGILATTADVVAVMDGDLQHDESILPAMLVRLRQGNHDVVVATRNGVGGSMGQFSKSRSYLSSLGKAASRSICRSELSDPMSGFFMLRRTVFLDIVHNLHGGGFKILLNLLASSTRTLATSEIGYTFRTRRHGKSKLNLIVGLEFLILILNKLVGMVVPLRFALFSIVGALGVLAHLVIFLFLTHIGHVRFGQAQIIATIVAMMENFFLNNSVTFRDCKLHGANLGRGLLRFSVTCAFGAWANLVFARSLSQSGVSLYLAGLAGIILGSVWNLSVSSVVTWKLQPVYDKRVDSPHPLVSISEEII